MSHNPEGLFYAETHEWVSIEGEIAVIGISDHAQAQLGELVFVELPDVGDVVDAGDEVAVVESVKTASDVYTPVSGEVIEVNHAVVDEPELVNHYPYAEGWLFKVRIEKPEQVDNLMTADEYSARHED